MRSATRLLRESLTLALSCTGPFFCVSVSVLRMTRRIQLRSLRRAANLCRMASQRRRDEMGRALLGAACKRPAAWASESGSSSTCKQGGGKAAARRRQGGSKAAARRVRVCAQLTCSGSAWPPDPDVARSSSRPAPPTSRRSSHRSALRGSRQKGAIKALLALLALPGSQSPASASRPSRSAT